MEEVGTSENTEATSSIYTFTPRNLTLQLSIGRKHNAWYIIFARRYRTADSREICRLDQPSLRFRHRKNGSRFTFNPKAFTGWEPPGERLLEYLLSVDPAILKVVSRDADDDSPTEVEILIPEHRLAHWCERCHRWETIKDQGDGRWRAYRYAGYLCPSCFRKDSFFFRLLRLVAHAFMSKISTRFRTDASLP
ncbi:hypothetical protein VNI00_011681 [Paramarasmius palmivorus]|uniref:Uncharacterized protein n=1 Tax=Paramarasmius palmivorus TaxID=297713 RepID=A0AAW0CC22_9AGAR